MTIENSRKNRCRGFTIIELLVVIAILGVLMAMVVPKAGEMIARGKENHCRNNLKQLHTAAISCMTENHENRYAYRHSGEWWHVEDGVFYRYDGWVSWANDSLDFDALRRLWPSPESQSGKMRDDLGTGAVARFGVENGTLFKYMNNSLKHYVCPVIKERKKADRVNVYRTYAMGDRFRLWSRLSDNINASKTLLFAEVFPTSTEGEAEKRESYKLKPVRNSFEAEAPSKVPGRRQGDCCLTPENEKMQGEEFIGYDIYDNSLKGDDRFGIHPAPGGKKVSLVVFLDGHIERVFSVTPRRKLNPAYYYVRGQDPHLEDNK
jgi:prepilin-type N-terminal cleavage/methylation domain-containing protein